MFCLVGWSSSGLKLPMLWAWEISIYLQVPTENSSRYIISHIATFKKSRCTTSFSPTEPRNTCLASCYVCLKRKPHTASLDQGRFLFSALHIFQWDVHLNQVFYKAMNQDDCQPINACMVLSVKNAICCSSARLQVHPAICVHFWATVFIIIGFNLAMRHA